MVVICFVGWYRGVRRGDKFEREFRGRMGRRRENV